MAEGYIEKGTRPNVSWWLDQVKAGEAFRKKYALEEKWSTWRDYARGQWRKGIMPVNIYFMMMRTLIPRIYFRNPSVSVIPAMPGFENIAFAKTLQRVDNKMIDQMKLKREMKRCIRDAIMFGTGVPKIGFGAQFTPTPNFGATEEPIAKQGTRFEYRDNVFKDMPWVARVHPKDFIVPSGLEVFEDARWVGHRVRRAVDDVRNDPRLENRSEIRSSKVSDIIRPPIEGFARQPVEMVDLYEIRDKKRAKVMVINPYARDKARLMYFGDDEFLINGAFPLFPIQFNDDDEVFWATPDSQIIEPQQLEINEIRTQSMKHRRLTLMKLLYKKGSISEEELEKMLSEDVMAAVAIDGELSDVKSSEAATIPQELLLEEEKIMSDVRELLGLGRNQFAEYGKSRTGKGNPPTAFEASVVKMASELRVDEKRDILADTLVAIVEAIHVIIFNHWSTEQVVDVVGPGGVPIWVKYTGDMLKGGQYNVKVDPDSSLPETKEIRMEKAVQTYSLLKSNPLIDPMRLTQYLLSELHGVQFDDMIRMLPPPSQGPNGPVAPQQYGNLIQQQLAEAAKNPDKLRPPQQALALPAPGDQ